MSEREYWEEYDHIKCLARKRFSKEVEAKDKSREVRRVRW